MRTVVLWCTVTLIWSTFFIWAPHSVSAAGTTPVLSTGTNHTCAVIAGKVYCWGDNEKGQLGNNDSPNDTDSAVLVRKEVDDQPLTGVTTVTSGFGHSCAVAQGTAYCWGDNTTNQLGNKNYPQANRAVPVLTSSDTPLTGVSLIEAGTYHTCAIVRGKIYCWGLNGSGQLGNNNMPTASNHAILAKYDASEVIISGATSISSGANSTCAVIKGIAHCWGNNVSGQLGNNDTGTNRAGAVPVKTVLNLPLSGASHISHYNSHACALVKGAVYCWGSNNAGQLGDTTKVDKGYAVKALFADGSALTGVSTVTTGGTHTCAIVKKAAYCWGSSFYGAIGNNTDNTDPTSEFYGAVAVLTPTLAPLVGATTITSGEDFSCAVANKTIYCWGKNSQGQLGNQDTGNLTKVAIRPMYAQPDLLSGIQAISAGMGHTCAIRKGTLWCWGNNNSGQLGDTTTLDRDGAVATVTNSGTPLTAVTAVSTGRSHTCAVSKGIVYCWGNNGNGQLGNNSIVLQSETPVAVQISGGALLTGATRVAAGTGHSCAIAKGMVYCWGNNGSGELGNNTTDPSLFAVPVMLPGGILPLKGAIAVTTGTNHSCALVKGSAYCWGFNDQGQLGINSLSPVSVATMVQLDDSTALTNITAISAGASHTCAVSNAQAYCWGNNEFGQLGNNDATHVDRDGAVQVQTSGGALLAVASVSAGGEHACATTKSKELFCWGRNNSGQLGNNGATPVSDIAVLTQNDDASAFNLVTAVEAGSQYTCAIRATQVYCWGNNFVGQLGNKDILTNPDGAAPTYFYTKYITGIK